MGVSHTLIAKYEDLTPYIIRYEMGLNLKKIDRAIYGLLDWLGDIGGLNDALFIIIELSMIPFKRFTFGSFILTRLFRVRKKL